MMSSVGSSLERVASSTFEDLGFMLADREPSGAQLAAGLDAVVEVGFTGPASGRLELGVYGGVLASLAMNMLGETEPPARAVQLDALGEVANVICGNLLPELAGYRELFRLGAPTPLAAPGGDEGALLVAVLGLEGGRAEVRVHAADPASARRLLP